MTAAGLHPDGSTAFLEGDRADTLLEPAGRAPERPEPSPLLAEALIEALQSKPDGSIASAATSAELAQAADQASSQLVVGALDQVVASLSGRIPGLVSDEPSRLRLQSGTGDSSDDALSGLVIHANDGLPASVVDDNLSPLLGEAFASDQMLVYREASDTPADPISPPFSNEALPAAADQGLGVSSLTSTATPSPLQLVIREDEPLQLDLQPLLSDSTGYGPFQIIDRRTGEVVTWLSASSRRPDADLSGRVVIETDWQSLPVDLPSPDELSTLPASTELRLNLLVSDNRNRGRGLLGLEGTLRWNRQAGTVLAIDLNDALPLFRNTGSDTWSDGLATLSAAGLPLAGVGEALGDQRRERFAQVTLRLDDPSQPLDLGFLPTLFPAVAGQTVGSGELLTLGLHRPPVPVLQGQADQAQVGNHTLAIEARSPSGELWQRELLVDVQNSNDAPVLRPGPTSTTLVRERPFQWAVADLFSDEDQAAGDTLRFSLLPGSDPRPWLSLDPESGLLSGTPPPGPADQISLRVLASDRAGASISQSLVLTLEPVNHPPQPNPAVPWPQLQLLQGEALGWAPPPGSFLDADGAGELRYSLATPLPWLTIDPTSGQLQLAPGADDVGEHRIGIVATDPRGEATERSLQLTVANINEAPRLEIGAIEAFRRVHGPVLQVLEDQPLLLDPFAGGAWFSDADLQLRGADRDVLTYAIQLSRQLADGSLQPVQADWLQADPASGTLQITPGNSDVGRYRLRMTARDRAGLQASTSLSLEVLNGNDAPRVIPELARAYASISLPEDQPFRISIPAGLFVDDDAGDALSLDVRLASGGPLPAWVHFDADDRSLAGVASSDLAALALVITARDRQGERCEHPLELLLPRSVEAPLVQTRTIRRHEGQPLALAEALEAQAADPDSETLRYRIVLSDVPERWQLVSRLGPLPAANDGLIACSDLSDLQLINADGGASGPVELPLAVISEERNGSQASREVLLRFEVAPVVAPPRLNPGAPIAALDPFSPLPLNAFAAAEPVDGDGSEMISRYTLTYRPSSTHPTAADLQVLDPQGAAIGQWTIRRPAEGGEEWQLSLSAAEWTTAILTSNDRLLGEEARFRAVAYAIETTTGEEAGSTPLELRLPVTPQVLEPTLQALDTTSRIGVNDDGSGEAALFRFSAEAASGRDHPALLVTVASGVTVLPGGNAITITATDLPAPGPGQHTMLIQGDDPANLSLRLVPPEGFLGHLTLSVQALASARPEPGSRFVSLETDLNRGYAARGEVIELDLNVVPRARPPRLENLRFDAASGELLFDLSRGANSRGLVNAAEQINLSISGLPEGYGLVLPDGSRGIERRAGASDAFATAILFSLPPQTDDPVAAAAPIRLPLRLRSLATSNQEPQAFSAAALRLEATALLPASDDLPSGERSPTVSASLTLGPWIGPRAGVALDPLIVDLGGDGLALSSLESSATSFDLLLNGRPQRTAWLAPGDRFRDDAILVLDRDHDGVIRSASELISECFGSNDQRRPFRSGIEALSSLDSNHDGHLDGTDTAWSSLQLWFDDGDGQSRPEELVNLAERVTTVDLNATALIDRSAAANPLLRQGALTLAEGRAAAFFDVGLRFDPVAPEPGQAPGSAPRLAFEARLAPGLILEEGGDPVAMELQAPALDSLSPEEANLTLVRIMGLPDGLVPSLGLRDSRGDWLFTWGDLQNSRSQGRELTVESIDHGSGSATASVLVTRIGLDGSVLASAVTPLAVDVRPVADRPQLLLRRLQGQEDLPIALDQLIRDGRASLVDSDGSEQLSYRLSGLPAGMRVMRRLSSGDLEPLALEPEPGQVPSGTASRRLVTPLASLAEVLLLPPPDRSGRIDLTITAIATESANGDSAAISRTATIVLAAIVDPPRLTLQPELTATGLVLQEEGSVDLDGIQAALIDGDGSEELLVELANLPDWVRVERADDPGWRPEAQIALDDGRRVVRVRGADLSSGQLRLRDAISATTGAGGPDVPRKEDFLLQVVALSRELSNGQLSVDQTTLQSEPQRLPVLFSSQAHHPVLQLVGGLQTWEDDPTPLPLASVVQASLSPDARREDLRIELRGLPPDLALCTSTGATVIPQRWEAGAPVYAVASLGDLQLVPTAAQRSGRIPLTIEAISRSSTGGGEARSGPRTLWVAIDPVADPPLLQAPTQWLIDGEGRVSLEGLQISSPDTDGSERLSLVLLGVPPAVQLLGPARPIRAPGADGQLQDGWEIAAADLGRVQLQLPPEHPDLPLLLRARSREVEGGSRSEAWSDPIALDVLAGALAIVPQLEVSGPLLGDEDTPIPLLSEEGGVIQAALVGTQAQSLHFRLWGLPERATLRRWSEGRWQILSPDRPGSGTYSLDSLAGVAVQLAADASGEHRLQVEAIAMALRSADRRSRSLEVTLQVRPINDAPRPQGGSDISLQEGEERMVSLADRFIDADAGDQLRYGLEGPSLPDWMTLDPSNGLLHLHPDGRAATADGQPLTVTITATDRAGRQARQLLRVAVGNVNQAPEINPDQPDSYSLIQGQAWELALASLFRDADLIHGDRLQITLAERPSWLEISDSGVLRGTPGNDAVGPLRLPLIATDRSGLQAHRELLLMVENRNDPPALNPGFVSGEVQHLRQGDPLHLDLYGLFTDPDRRYGDSLQISTSSSGGRWPGWLRWDGRTGVLSGTPGNDDLGEVRISWTASDGEAEARYERTFIIENVNDAPVAGTLPPQRLEQDELLALDLSDLIRDPDFGDRLRYELTVEDLNGRPVQAANWLTLRDREQEARPVADRLNLIPVLRDPTTGDLLRPDQFEQLPAGSLVSLELLAQDDRLGISQRGLLGVDLDLRWTPGSLELVSSDPAVLRRGLTPDLPLFATIDLSRQHEGRLHLQAASAPALGIGSPLGDQNEERLLQVMLRVRDPQQLALVDLQVREESMGGVGLGWMEGDPSEGRVRLGSWSNARGLELQARPHNDQVGTYVVSIRGSDPSGSSATTSFRLEVSNRNDAPVLIRPLQPVRFRDNRQYALQLDQAFADPDSLHGDRLSFSLEVLSGPAQADHFQIVPSRGEDGQPQAWLQCNVPGLTTSSDVTLRLQARDVAGLETSQTLTVTLMPGLDPLPLSSGLEDPGRIDKNVRFNLADRLDLAPLGSGDPQDITSLHLRVLAGTTLEPALGLTLDATQQGRWRQLWRSVQDGDRVEWSCDLEALADLCGRPAAGLLASIDLIPPRNGGLLMPSGSVGLPVELWTDTRVRGDTSGLYGSERSNPVNAWLEIINVVPSFDWSGARTLILPSPANGDPISFDPDRPLWSLADLFPDEDRLEGDVLELQVTLPPELQQVLQWVGETGSLRWRDQARFDTALLGRHRIDVMGSDSQYALGDQDAFSRGALTLEFRTAGQATLVSAINQLQTLAEDPGGRGLLELQQVLRGELNLTDASLSVERQQTLATTGSLLASLPSLRQLLSQPLEQPQLAALLPQLLRNLSQGQALAARTGLDAGPPLFVYSPGAVLSQAGLRAVNPDLVADYLSRYPAAEIQTPIDELSFEVASPVATSLQGSRPQIGFAVVNLELPLGGFALNRLIKTRPADLDGDGIPEATGAWNLTLMPQALAADPGTGLSAASALNASLFDVVDYSRAGQSPVLRLDVNRPEAGRDLLAAVQAALAPGEDLDTALGRLDGSGYLIDLNNDGKADLIRLLLLDQGFFDTIDRPGLIGDPLIPAQLGQAVVPPQPPETVLPGRNSQPMFFDTPAMQAEARATNSRGVDRLEGRTTARPTALALDPNRPSTANLNAGHRSTEAEVGAADGAMAEPGAIGDARASKGLQDSGSWDLEWGSVASRLQRTLEGVPGALPKLVDSLASADHSRVMVALLIGATLLPLLVERGLVPAAGLELEPLHLQQRRGHRPLPMRWVLPKRQGGAHLLVQLAEGKLRIEELAAGDTSTDVESRGVAPDPIELRPDLLWRLVGGSTEPGRLVAHLEQALQQLINGDGQGRAVAWQTWIQELSHRHRSTDTPSMMRAFLSRRLHQGVQRCEREHQDLIDGLMALQILHCYQQLGGDVGRVIA